MVLGKAVTLSTGSAKTQCTDTALLGESSCSRGKEPLAARDSVSSSATVAAVKEMLCLWGALAGGGRSGSLLRGIGQYEKHNIPTKTISFNSDCLQALLGCMSPFSWTRPTAYTFLQEQIVVVAAGETGCSPQLINRCFIVSNIVGCWRVHSCTGCTLACLIVPKRRLRLHSVLC